MTPRKKSRSSKRRSALRRRLHRHRKAPGSPPGTLVYTGAPREAPAQIKGLHYGADTFEEFESLSPSEARALRDRDGVAWIDVDGLTDVNLISEIGARFDLHRLVLEDVLSTSQRSKVETYDGFLFIVLRMIREIEGQVAEEQVSLVLGTDFVLSFQEQPGDVFEPVRQRLREGRGIIRGRGPDYLAYALIDAVVDHYFHVVEIYAEQVNAIEDRLLEDVEAEVPRTIHELKQEVLAVRRAAWPLREALAELYGRESPLVTPATRTFFRDVYDHDLQVIDAVEAVRDLLGGSMDLYLSLQSHRMNEVMKVLTMIATIFIPLSFLAGLYGMNFEVMPELHWPWAYPTLLGVMAVVTVLMLTYFRRNRWF